MVATKAKKRETDPTYGTTTGYTNEYRVEHGMKPLTGKPKGSKEKESTRKKKSETGKTMLMIQDLHGKYYRVKREVGLKMITTGEYQMGGTGRPSKGHSEESRKKLSEIAKNRPKHHCDVCGRDIIVNKWNEHLQSQKHAFQLSKQNQSSDANFLK
jgi:hypothetical protein